MKISKEMVEYVAILSRLKLSDAEADKAQESLGRILEYMDVLNKLDTSDIEPMSHAFAVKNVLRDDVVKPSYDRDLLLSNAPMRDDEAFIVPKAVD